MSLPPVAVMMVLFYSTWFHSAIVVRGSWFVVCES
jgi:hypothetical protein